ncbi:MAG: hypothetical protein IJ654_01600 [Bacteroidales bacterium]|nr:hypothetical protein [Bacteroidales bacterium]
MFTWDHTFRRFAALMDEEKIWLDPAVSFRRICRGLGVSARSFDRFLNAELGFHGDEILHNYRRSAYKKD